MVVSLSLNIYHLIVIEEDPHSLDVLGALGGKHITGGN